MLRIFIYRKIERLRPGLNPRTREPGASMLTTRPPKPLPRVFNIHFIIILPPKPKLMYFISIVAGLRDRGGGSSGRVSSLFREELKSFGFAHRQDWLWDTSSLLFSGYQRRFSQDVRRAERESHLSNPRSVSKLRLRGVTPPLPVIKAYVSLLTFSLDVLRQICRMNVSCVLFFLLISS
jgi:hypothetical protein